PSRSTSAASSPLLRLSKSAIVRPRSPGMFASPEQRLKRFTRENHGVGHSARNRIVASCERAARIMRRFCPDSAPFRENTMAKRRKKTNHPPKISRREFIEGTGAAILVVSAAGPALSAQSSGAPPLAIQPDPSVPGTPIHVTINGVSRQLVVED